MAGRKVIIIAILIYLLDGLSAHKTVVENDNNSTAVPFYNNIRLPSNVLPIDYTIYLHPNITDGKFRYTGDIKIILKVTQPTDKIVIHSNSHYITYIGVSEEAPRRRPIKVLGTRVNKKNEYLIIKLDEELKTKKRYLLQILFSARISRLLTGFYRSSYKTKSGKIRHLATTDFEPTGARKAFPCFDEPAMKAKFTITIVREKQHSSLSNMPIMKQITRKDGLVEDHFQKSVIMSSYLIAFVISDFAHLSTKTKRGIKIRVWAPPDLIEQARYALEVTPKIIDYYEKFFKINFPLPKQDLIAIPDFESGAMENWGLITYRLTALLYDEKTSSSDRKQWVAMVIAHELAHQWFGNLVTMKWWSDLWLNEGFANFVESLGAHIIGGKEWKVMDQFVNDNLHASMELDSKYDSHPISVTVKNPAEISELFDIISYNKGSSIIRMMRDFIGENRFRNGLAMYLEKYKYKNADSNDLWESLTKATNRSINVKKVMGTWTLQMGYPVVNVYRDLKIPNRILITQERFTSDVQKPNATKKSGFHYKWEVPITYYFENSRNQLQRDWLHYDDKKPLSIESDKNSKWLKVNANQIGFYRVNYDETTWTALAEQLQNNHKLLSVADRSNLLDDAFAMAFTGRLSQSQALDMTLYFTKERDYVPFVSGLAKLNSIGWLLRNRPGHKSYEKYVIQQITPIIKKLGWEDKGPTLDRLLRKFILSQAISHNMTDAVKTAMNKYHAWMYENKSMPANLQAIVYTAGVEYGDKKEWDYMLSKYKSTINPAERDTFMYALTETSNPKILLHYLKNTLNEKLIRSQDTCSVIARIAKNKIGTRMAKDFVKSKWKRLFKRYSEHGRDMGRLVSVFEKGKTISDLHEAAEFLRNRDLGAGQMSAKRALSNIYSNTKWLETNEDTVVKWFDENV